MHWMIHFIGNEHESHIWLSHCLWNTSIRWVSMRNHLMCMLLILHQTDAMNWVWELSIIKIQSHALNKYPMVEKKSEQFHYSDFIELLVLNECGRETGKADINSLFNQYFVGYFRVISPWPDLSILNMPLVLRVQALRKLMVQKITKHNFYDDETYEETRHKYMSPVMNVSFSWKCRCYYERKQLWCWMMVKVYGISVRGIWLFFVIFSNRTRSTHANHNIFSRETTVLPKNRIISR